MFDNFQDIRAMLLRNGFVPVDTSGYNYCREYKGIMLNANLGSLQASASFLDKEYSKQNPYSTKNCVINVKLFEDAVRTEFVLNNLLQTSLKRFGD